MSLKHCLSLSLIFVGISIHAQVFTGANKPHSYTTTKKIVADNGAVVSAHALASEAGLLMLKKGGNAVDAAIATQLALAVVYPNAGNLGGGGFLVAQLNNGKRIALDFREMAPSKAHRDMYIDSNGVASTQRSQNGHLASGVPGTVAGLFESHRYAKLPMAVLIQPAIELAEKGFVITDSEARSLNSLQGELKRYNSVMPVFYRSQPSAALIEAEMKRGNGIISKEDLKSYQAKWRVPHEFDYKGYHIVGMPMPSSGGLLLHQMMKMVEDRNIGSMGFQSPASVQLMTEVMRRAFADRGKYMGDADFYPVPVSKLTDPEYLTLRMKDYKSDSPTPSSQLGAGNVNFHESEETTHLSVLDEEGNADSVTTTPNIHPGKRMLSSMTPTLVLKNEKPYIVVGTPGGTTIPTQIFQALINILEFGMSAEDAINKPKFHHQWLPDELYTEKGFIPATAEALKKMGYQMGKERGGIGRTEIILVRPDGKKEAVADRRGDDAAAGY